MKIKNNSVIGQDLLDKAIDLGTRGSDDHWCAFPSDVALLVVDKLEEANLVILGGDVWKEEGSLYIPAYANWHYELNPTDLHC